MSKSVWVLLEGLDELRKALRDMPEAARSQADAIVEEAAQDTARDLLGVYPGNGPMRRGVFVVNKGSKLQSRWAVESRSPQANWWEFGTQNRVTQKLWRRGAAPAHYGQGLVGIASTHRRTMRQRLIALVEGFGFVVTETFDG